MNAAHHQHILTRRIIDQYFIGRNFISEELFATPMHLLNKADQSAEDEEAVMTFYRFIKMTEKRQLQKMWQAKNKIYLRKQHRQQINNRIHIIPPAFAEGLKKYQAPSTLNQHIHSSRFQHHLTPTRMHSQQIESQKHNHQLCKMPNLRRLYRRDELNSIKELGRPENILDQLEEKETAKLKRIRLSLPVAASPQLEGGKSRSRYGNVSPTSLKSHKFSNPERILKI